MKNFKTLLLVTLISISVYAQQFEVSGVVTSYSDTKPLPGVNVMVKGTTNGTQTDFDGKYKLTVKKGDSLTFSYIGFKSAQIPIGKPGVYNVVLEEDHSELEEVVVVGYGIHSRKSSVGSIVTSVQSDHISNTLSGKASGVLIRGVSSLNSNFNKNSNYKIEGMNGQITLSTDQPPLYIVDGVAINPQYNNIVSNFDSEKIEHINVYKKNKAQRLFGSLAKNGCIIINTKEGNYRIENDESYAKISENQFQTTQLAPLSTFSIDVDKASYSNIRRMINNGLDVPIDAVKIEEMINYFDYNYPQPSAQHPFSINSEVMVSPWNSETKLVKIGLQGKTYRNEALPASNLTFLIDVSGSMDSPTKLPLLKSAFKLLVNQLRKKDKISIVVYAGAAGMVLPPTSGDQKETILNALDALEAGGSTAGGAGIELAYRLAVKNYVKEGNNRVILATDGDFNVGESSDRAMESLIEEKRKSGVYLSVLGFGYGNLKDSKLELLADKGNGNHAYIDSMQEAQKVFGKEFGGTLYTIAKDVKIQIEFNPQFVKGYRLIGYENRLLAPEDFVDDSKDAGELGSGHSVTALYEIVPVNSKSDYLNEVENLKYSSSSTLNKNMDELFTVRFRYKKPDENVSKELVHVQANELSTPSSDFKFASAVALFGMKLRDSQFFNEANKQLVLDLAMEGKGMDKNGYRSEFIRLVEATQNIN